MDTRNLPPTISVAQAAELLGIGINHTYRAVAAGDLPAMRLGGRILVLTAPLQRMLRLDEAAAAGSAGAA